MTGYHYLESANNSRSAKMLEELEKSLSPQEEVSRAILEVMTHLVVLEVSQMKSLSTKSSTMTGKSERMSQD